MFLILKYFFLKKYHFLFSNLSSELVLIVNELKDDRYG